MFKVNNIYLFLRRQTGKGGAEDKQTNIQKHKGSFCAGVVCEPQEGPSLPGLFPFIWCQSKAWGQSVGPRCCLRGISLFSPSFICRSEKQFKIEQSASLILARAAKQGGRGWSAFALSALPTCHAGPARRHPGPPGAVGTRGATESRRPAITAGEAVSSTAISTVKICWEKGRKRLIYRDHVWVGSFTPCCTVLEGVTDRPRGAHEENVEVAGREAVKARAAESGGSRPLGELPAGARPAAGARVPRGRKALSRDAGPRGVSAFSSTPCAGWLGSSLGTSLYHYFIYMFYLFGCLRSSLSCGIFCCSARTLLPWCVGSVAPRHVGS